MTHVDLDVSIRLPGEANFMKFMTKLQENKHGSSSKKKNKGHMLHGNISTIKHISFAV
jgi:hypothetical protein